MVQWFFLDRVYAKTGRPPIADQFDLVIEALAHITKPPLALAQTTVTRAKITLHTTVIQKMPKFGACNRAVSTHLGIK